MRDSAFETINVEKKEEPTDYTLVFVIMSIILICVAVFVYFLRKSASKTVDVEPISQSENVPEAQAVEVPNEQNDIKNKKE
jgi:hypothetical protein